MIEQNNIWKSRIYINTEISYQDLIEEIASYFNTNIKNSSKIITPKITIDVKVNEKTSSKQSKKDGFLHFPYFLELDYTFNKEHTGVEILNLFRKKTKSQLDVVKEFGEYLSSKYSVHSIGRLMCTIYVNTHISHKELVEKTANCVSAQPSDEYYIYTNNAELFVDENELYNAKLSEEEKRESINFPYFIYVNLIKDKTIENQIDLVTKLLEYFWSKNYPTVASCHFEKELPHNGGYNPRECIEIN